MLDSSLVLMYLIELIQISEAANQVEEASVFLMWERVEREGGSLNV